MFFSLVLNKNPWLEQAETCPVVLLAGRSGAELPLVAERRLSEYWRRPDGSMDEYAVSAKRDVVHCIQLLCFKKLCADLEVFSRGIQLGFK